MEHEELSPRVALERKELLSGIDPKTFWYNRLGRILLCPFSHNFRTLATKSTPYPYITAIEKECVRCGYTFTEHI